MSIHQPIGETAARLSNHTDEACEKLRTGIHLDPFYRLYLVPTVGSTNQDVMAMAAEGEAEGTVLVALEQRQGRGRHGRSWYSPAGNLYCSVLLRPTRPLGELGELSFVVACALSEALCQVVPGLSTQHKWPNDVLVDGAKISGILLESVCSPSDPSVTIGTGVNIQTAPTAAPYPVTTLCNEAAKYHDAATPNVAELLNAYSSYLLRLYRLWLQEGFAPIGAQWKARAYGLGEPVSVKQGANQITGLFEDIDPKGALVLLAPDGHRHHISAGELFFGSLSAQQDGGGIPEHAARD